MQGEGTQDMGQEKKGHGNGYEMCLFYKDVGTKTEEQGI